MAVCFASSLHCEWGPSPFTIVFLALYKVLGTGWHLLTAVGMSYLPFTFQCLQISGPLKAQLPHVSRPCCLLSLEALTAPFPADPALPLLFGDHSEAKLPRSPCVRALS